MSTSETDSDSEPVLATDTVSSLTAFANLSATRQPGPTDQSTVSWAVDTLATLDFRLVRKDDALHGLIQNCASAILALFDTVLQQGSATDNSCSFIPDIVGILRPSFLHLLFQYRRLFRIIAARDFKPNSAPLAIVCWVDVILAKLGDVTAFIAGGLDPYHPDQSLPESLKAQREEDNLRAAIQLPDNWDMLPSTLLSERVSTAAKRLSVRLMLGKYILGPALSGNVGEDEKSVTYGLYPVQHAEQGVFHSMHQLLPTFAEFVRQRAARVDDLRSESGAGLQYLLQQERVTSAMAISLFAAADIAHKSTIDPERAVTFRPQTMAAAMQILRFILNEERYITRTSVLNPSDHLDAPTSVIIRWGIVPQWAWSVWSEYGSLHADTIVHLTTTYLQHHSAGPEPSLEASELMSTNSRSTGQAAVISVMVDLVFRFISMLSAGAYCKQVPAGMMSVLQGSCRLISQWMNRNSCGIQHSRECCKALIILFGYLSRSEQHVALNELVIESLTYMRGECVQEAWAAAAEDNRFCFLETLDQSIIQAKTALSQDDFSESVEGHVVQLMQLFVIMISKGVRPLDGFIGFIEAVAERVLEASLNGREFLYEALLMCLAAANLSEIDFPFSKVSAAVDEEGMWRLGMCGGDTNLFLASAFSLYITSALVAVDPLTYLEGFEHLLDMALLICAQHYYPPEDEPLALIVLPTICDALAHLLEHRDDATGVLYDTHTRASVLGSVLSGGDDSDSVRLRLWSTARRVCLDRFTHDGGGRGYELVFCRPRLLYVTRDL